jgi:DNA-directed RNA polymerase subunit K/omega
MPKKVAIPKSKNVKPINKKKQEAGGPVMRDEADIRDYSEESQDDLAKEAIQDEEEAVEVEENLDEVEDEDALGENAEIEDEDALEQEGEEEPEAEDVVEGEGAEHYEGDGDDTCLYNFKKKKVFADSDDEVEEEEVFEDDEKQIDEIVKPSDRETKDVLFKHERVRILGDRAKQLSLGAKSMLKNVDHMTPKEIAKEELAHGVIPFIIERALPDGKRERWRVSELKIRN